MEDYIQERTENNSGLIYKADFYPIYTQRLGKWLSAEEIIILSFVYYWTKWWSYIYATNENLMELTGAKKRTVIKLVKNLVDLWYIEITSKTIVGLWTDRKMKYIGGAKNALPWDGGAKNALPLECASNAESIGGAKNALPEEPKDKAKSTGGAKNALPWEENKFVGNTLDNSEKSQKNGNPSEVQILHPEKNNIKEYIIYDKNFSSTSSDVAAQSEDVNNTELDNEFMFNDGSIEFYTHSVLQQTKLEDKMNVLWPLFPHLPWYKWKKKDTLKALKQFTLDHDFVYNLIYDMKLLSFQCEYGLVKWQWFMSQWIDTYTPLTEKERDKQLYKVIEYIKRHKEDQSVFESRAQEMIKFIGYPKYHEIFRSIPANVWDRVILDLH